jgi:RNA polymerase sigma-70 factor (ECF subfamily)
VDLPPLPGKDTPEPNGEGEVLWLQPYPDMMLDGLADTAPGPEARYEAAEAISLAFVTALQALPPRQRAVLILRDVLGFANSQVADILDSSEDAAASALKRARATMRDKVPTATESQPPPRPDSPEERDLVARFTRAYQAGDIAAVVALLTEDVAVTMPPQAVEFHGRELVSRFLAATGLRPGRRARLIPTRANGQPAFGLYVLDQQAGIFRAAGLLVLTLSGDQIRAMTGFDNSLLPHFGLPRTLPD